MIQIRTTGFLVALGALASVRLIALAAPATTSATTPDGLLGQVQAHFNAWDADHSGAVDLGELDVAIDNPAVQGPEAAAAVAVRGVLRASKERTPLTLENLTTAAPRTYAFAYTTALERIANTPRALFATGTPHIDKLRQGRLGDCFLLASLGTFASHAPQKLADMVKVQSDGQVQVTFATGQKVVLPPPTDGEIAVGASSGGDGVWVNLFEKAMGQVLLDAQQVPRSVSPTNIIDKGGAPLTVLQYLTGHKVVRINCAPMRDPKLTPAEREAKLADCRAALIKTQDAGRLIVCGNGARPRDMAPIPGILFLHSYAVLGYDAKTDEITLRNPQGRQHTPKGAPGMQYGYPTKDGRFTLPLAELVKWLGAFSIETDEPYNPLVTPLDTGTN